MKNNAINQIKTSKKTAVECFGGNMNDTRRRKINIKSTRHSDAAGVTFSENVGLWVMEKIRYRDAPASDDRQDM